MRLLKQRQVRKISLQHQSQSTASLLLKRSATYTLIAAICGAYLLQLVVPSIEIHLVLPNIDYLKSTNEWYRLFTVALVHSGLLHLGFNMYALMVLGNPLEAAFGKNKLLIIFFVSLLTGSLTSTFLASASSYSVGASGAVFGLFGALAVVGKRIGADTRSIFVIIAINFAIGFVLGGIDWHAHLGGLIGGVITAQLILNKR